MKPRAHAVSSEDETAHDAQPQRYVPFAKELLRKYVLVPEPAMKTPRYKFSTPVRAQNYLHDAIVTGSKTMQFRKPREVHGAHAKRTELAVSVQSSTRRGPGSTRAPLIHGPQ